MTSGVFIALLRWVDPEKGQQVFFKGPFDSIRQAKLGCEAIIREENLGPHCAEWLVLPAVDGGFAHTMTCADGKKCGWVEAAWAK